ncbi:MAG: hypothetical protein OEN55_10015 [Alphaproteobacteria bacterium]|nr:hypothetical protein [Alphaproteobacteria bacterium]
MDCNAGVRRGCLRVLPVARCAPVYKPQEVPQGRVAGAVIGMAEPAQDPRKAFKTRSDFENYEILTNSGYEIFLANSQKNTHFLHRRILWVTPERICARAAVFSHR